MRDLEGNLRIAQRDAVKVDWIGVAEVKGVSRPEAVAQAQPQQSEVNERNEARTLHGFQDGAGSTIA
jgi:hypothetical protein